MATVSINTGELFVGDRTYILEAPGIGSCVAVCLYDAKNKNGGLAHIMLPTDKKDQEKRQILVVGKDDNIKDRSFHYADTAIDRLVEDLRVIGSSPDKLTAKIFGGSEMFSSLISSKRSVGIRNIDSVREKLRELAIPIIAEDVGGKVGRSVKFFLENGETEIRKRI